MPEFWPFVPMPDLHEKYTWNTDIRSAPSGEIRDGLHNGQRIITYDYACPGAAAQSEVMIRAAAGSVFEVPIWSEAEKVGPIADTDTVIAGGQYAGYSGRAMVRESGQVLVVDVVQDGAQLNLSAPIGTAFTDATIAPVVTAFCPRGANLVKRRGGRMRAQVEFLVQESGWWPHSDFTTYQGLDYWPCAGVAINQLTGSVAQALEVIDSGMGVQALEGALDYPRARYSAEQVATDPEKIWAMKRWLYHLRGRDRAFWMPAWGGNVATTTEVAAGGTTLPIPAKGHVPEQFIGQHIALSNDQFRQVTSALKLGDVIYLTVPALSAPTDRVKLIRKMRLDADVIDMRHRLKFSAGYTAPLVEVPE